MFRAGLLSLFGYIKGRREEDITMDIGKARMKSKKQCGLYRQKNGYFSDPYAEAETGSSDGASGIRKIALSGSCQGTQIGLVSYLHDSSCRQAP